MPKVILEFNLPEERSEFEVVNNAGEYYSNLWDIDKYLRSVLKYDQDKDLTATELAEKVRGMITRKLYE